MSKLVEVAVNRSDSLKLAILLSSRLENVTGNKEEGITVIVLIRDLKRELLVVYSKIKIW